MESFAVFLKILSKKQESATFHICFSKTQLLSFSKLSLESLSRISIWHNSVTWDGKESIREGRERQRDRFVYAPTVTKTSHRE